MEEDGPIIWLTQDGSYIIADSDEGEDEIISNNEWIKQQDQYHPAKDTKVVKTISPGFYEIGYNQGKYWAERVGIVTDELVPLRDPELDEIASEITRFWEKADKFAEVNIVHKRGIMLYGGPGCGKTSFSNMLSVDVIKNGGIVFHVESANDLKMLITFVNEYFRDIQPDTPIFVVVEDIDQIVEQNESLVLNWLSGKDEFNHCVILATTNRIDDCNDLLLRPSRFDWVIQLKSPSEASRKQYLIEKNMNEELADKWVKDTKDFTMAQLKELYIAVQLLDNDYKAVIEKIQKQEKAVKNSTFTPKRKSIGFGS